MSSLDLLRSKKPRKRSSPLPLGLGSHGNILKRQSPKGGISGRRNRDERRWPKSRKTSGEKLKEVSIDNDREEPCHSSGIPLDIWVEKSYSIFFEEKLRCLC